MARKKGDGPRSEVVRALLKAAEVEFTTKGYAATTLDGIGKRAGFTKGAVYSSFSSKLELFIRMLREHLTVYFPVRMASIMAPEKGSNEYPDIDTIAHRLAEYSIEDAPWHCLNFEYALIAATDKDLAKVYRDNTAFSEGLIRGLVTSYFNTIGKSIDSSQIDIFTTIFRQTIISLALEGRVDPDTYSVEYRATIFKSLLQAETQSDS